MNITVGAIEAYSIAKAYHDDDDGSDALVSASFVRKSGAGRFGWRRSRWLSRTTDLRSDANPCTIVFLLHLLVTYEHSNMLELLENDRFHRRYTFVYVLINFICPFGDASIGSLCGRHFDDLAIRPTSLCVVSPCLIMENVNVINLIECKYQQTVIRKIAMTIMMVKVMMTTILGPRLESYDVKTFFWSS